MTGKFSIQKILGLAHSDNDKEPSRFSDLFSHFTDKITTPEEALSTIKPRDRVFLGTGCATPRTLTMALENSARALDDVEIYHFLVDGAYEVEMLFN